MMKSRIKFGSLLAISLMVLFCQVLSASVIYEAEINLFTDNANGGPTGSGYLNNDNVNFRMEIFNGGQTVTFKFYNDSTVDSSITDVFFDDGTLLGISGLSYSSGVQYDYPSQQNNLPAGNLLNPPFVTSQNFGVPFSADPDPPPTQNGIDDGLGEWLEIHFDLQYNDTEQRWGNLQDVISELRDGTLRVGMHVQSFPDGTSQSAISSPVVTPEPASICALGMGALFLLRKRRNRR